MTETLSITRDDRGVATLMLNRPDKHNALSATMIAELTQAAADLGADPDLRAIILTGAGASFCAGGDLGWMREQFSADRATRQIEARKLAHMLRALNEIPKPVIGRVQGQAFGGGIGMMSVCDIVIGVNSARFGLTETRLGLIPATIAPYVVARMGEGRAREVFLSAKVFDADEALRLGLLSRMVAPDALDAAVEVEIAPCLAASPSAMAEAKAVARSLGPPITDIEIEATIERLADIWETPDAAEGVGAFFDRRKAAWVV